MQVSPSKEKEYEAVSKEEIESAKINWSKVSDTSVVQPSYPVYGEKNIKVAYDGIMKLMNHKSQELVIKFFNNVSVFFLQFTKKGSEKRTHHVRFTVREQCSALGKHHRLRSVSRYFREVHIRETSSYIHYFFVV